MDLSIQNQEIRYVGYNRESEKVRKENNLGQANVINQYCKKMKIKVERMEQEIGSAQYFNSRLTKRNELIEEAKEIYLSDKTKTIILVSAMDRFSRNVDWYKKFSEKYPFIIVKDIYNPTFNETEKFEEIVEAQNEAKMLTRVNTKRTIDQDKTKKEMKEKLKIAINKMKLMINTKEIFQEKRTASFDIETMQYNKIQRYIKIISLVTDFGKHYLYVNIQNSEMSETYKKKIQKDKHKISDLEIRICNGEEETIHRFLIQLKEFNEEKELILVGFNSDTFDWNVIKDRMKSLEMDIKKYKLDNMKNLDYYKYLKRINFTVDGKVPNLSVFYKQLLLADQEIQNSVCKEIKKCDSDKEEIVGKLDVDYKQMQKDFINNKYMLYYSIYCLQDALIVLKAEEKLRLYEKINKLSHKLGIEINELMSHCNDKRKTYYDYGDKLKEKLNETFIKENKIDICNKMLYSELLDFKNHNLNLSQCYIYKTIISTDIKGKKYSNIITQLKKGVGEIIYFTYIKKEKGKKEEIILFDKTIEINALDVDYIYSTFIYKNLAKWYNDYYSKKEQFFTLKINQKEAILREHSKNINQQTENSEVELLRNKENKNENQNQQMELLKIKKELEILEQDKINITTKMGNLNSFIEYLESSV